MPSVSPSPATSLTVETDVPARLDRLPWARFHWLVVIALGITWILDGLEVTLAGSLSGALRESPSLKLSPRELGLSASLYLAGAVIGAVVFGYLTDRLGRKRLFNITLGVYLVATACTAFAWDFWSFALCRFFTGAGIGGEYTAINSAIQELIPARRRGWTDLVINGSFWIGAALGAGGSVVLLDPDFLPPDMGWRVAFGLGAGLGLIILFLRRYLPESPRWLMTHGHVDEAERVVSGIEASVRAEIAPADLPPPSGDRIVIRHGVHVGVLDLLRTVFGQYRSRAVLGLTLMVSQAFFYNAIFFTYALVLTDFYAVPADRIGLYILPFALGNFAGPLLLGRFFDTVGRKPMIAFTYAASGVLLAGTGYLFQQDAISATTLTFAWTVVFFFASAGASAAYLTVSESFPLEVRALAIALFYTLGTATGGVIGPWLFGVLIETQSREAVFAGYLFGAALMVIAAGVELAIGVKAERQPLESLAPPLASVR